MPPAPLQPTAERRRGILRVVHDGAGEPAWNMAVDEALLELAAAPTLRLYGWQPHAVSLGWFQRLADFADLPADTCVVRRLTGGGAIHHGDELTFALAVDADLLPDDLPTGYALVHDAAIAALAAIGVAAHRLAAGPGPSARPSARWCFAEPGAGDVLAAGNKLLGSAQRRIARTRDGRPTRRVLHHGSLVLERPALTPFVAAAGDVRDLDPACRRLLADTFVARLAEALDLVPAAGALDAAELALATQLRDQRYRRAEFTGQR